MWLKILGAIFIAFALMALELTGAPGGISKINLIVIALIFLVYYDYFWEGIVFSGTSGFLADFFTAGKFGLFSAIFIFLALILNIIMYNFFGAKNYTTFTVFSFFGLLIYGLLSAITRSVVAFNFSAVYLWQNISVKIPEIYFTFVAILAIYFIFERLQFVKYIKR